MKPSAFLSKCLKAAAFLAAALFMSACSNVSGPAGPYVTPTPTPFVTPTPIQRAPGIIRFSEIENMSGTTQELALSCDGASKIYYTLDGSIPNEEKNEYTGPFLLRAGTSVKVYCVTARALYEDGTWSDPVTRSYFIGRGADKRYDTMVISLTTDPSNLWDYETGIFTAGKIFDDYMKAHPRAHVDGSTPANYNQLRGMEGEREGHLEIFDQEGNLLLEQDCGIRTYGGWSRQNKMKSVKLFARKEYGDKTFDYPFFENALDESNNVIDVFKRIVVRGHGNDLGFAFIREELFQTLAGEAGYMSRASRPCAFYINGEYYGCYWLEENWHKSYFENHYGEYKGNLEIIEGKEMDLTTDDEESKYAADDWKKFYTTYAYADLCDDATYEKVCEELDVKEYIETYAFRMFIGDNDWPQNNYKAFKYYPAAGEHFTEGPYDGRWHILIHDTDYSSGIYDDNYSGKTLNWLLGSLNGVKKSVSPLFGHLMQRTDCKEYFVNKLLELANGVFSPDHFNATADAMNESRIHEQHYTYSSGKIDSWIKEDQLKGQLDRLKNWIKKRRTFLLSNVYNFFKLEGGRYTLKLTVPEGSELYVGNWTVLSDFTGSFYHDYDVTITGLGGINGRITGWMVNGQLIEGETLVLGLENMTEAECTVEPVFAK